MADFPQRFGKYLLLERLSCGGMAEVFRAKAFGVEGFQKTFALKRILPHISEDPEFITMFIDEAKIASRLQHGNICQIYEFGRVGDFYFQLMEYIAGFDLRRLGEVFQSRGASLPVGFILYVMARACEGLDYAHRKTDSAGNCLNIIHRDVSPQNIMVSYEGTVKLIDFGIAKAKSRASQTQAGVIKGKFAYMCPELLRGEAIDGRADIFAIGIVLYELLTAEPLFDRETDLDTLRAVMAADVPLPSSRNPEIPPEVDQVLLRALAASPEDRYQSAEELTEDLDRCVMWAGQPMSSNRIRKLMTDSFPAEITEEREKMLFFASFGETGETLLEPSQASGPTRPQPKTVETFSGRRLKQRSHDSDDFREEVTYVHGKSDTGERGLRDDEHLEEEPGEDLLREPRTSRGPEPEGEVLSADDLEELQPEELEELEGLAQLEGTLPPHDNGWLEANAATAAQEGGLDDFLVEPVGFDWGDDEVTGLLGSGEARESRMEDVYEPELVDELIQDPGQDENAGIAIPAYRDPQAQDSQAYDPQAYDPQAYDPQAYDPQAYDPQAYDPQAYDPQAYDPQAYDPQAYDPQAYDPQTYDPQTYDPQAFDPQGYNPQTFEQQAHDPQAYDPQAYDPQAYDPQAYDPQAYDPQAYDPQAYDPQAYDPQAYDPQAYDPQGYNPQTFEEQSYDPQAHDPQEPEQQAYDPQPYNPEAYDQEEHGQQPYDPRENDPRAQHPQEQGEGPERGEGEVYDSADDALGRPLHRGHALSGGYILEPDANAWEDGAQEPLEDSEEATVYDEDPAHLDDLRRKYGLIPQVEPKEPNSLGDDVMELEDEDLEVVDD